MEDKDKDIITRLLGSIYDSFSMSHVEDEEVWGYNGYSKGSSDSTIQRTDSPIIFSQDMVDGTLNALEEDRTKYGELLSKEVPAPGRPSELSPTEQANMVVLRDTIQYDLGDGTKDFIPVGSFRHPMNSNQYIDCTEGSAIDMTTYRDIVLAAGFYLGQVKDIEVSEAQKDKLVKFLAGSQEGLDYSCLNEINELKKIALSNFGPEIVAAVEVQEKENARAYRALMVEREKAVAEEAQTKQSFEPRFFANPSPQTCFEFKAREYREGEAILVNHTIYKDSANGLTLTLAHDNKNHSQFSCDKSDGSKTIMAIKNALEGLGFQCERVQVDGKRFNFKPDVDCAHGDLLRIFNHFSFYSKVEEGKSEKSNAPGPRGGA